MEKILVMHVAAQLAQAVAVNFPDNLPIDPEIKDPNLRGMNLAVWEEFRIFYRAIVQALKDESSWPNPDVPAGKLLPNLLQSLGPLFANPALQELLNKLLGAIPSPVAAPRGPLPDPGQAA